MRACKDEDVMTGSGGCMMGRTEWTGGGNGGGNYGNKEEMEEIMEKES